MYSMMQQYCPVIAISTVYTRQNNQHSIAIDCIVFTMNLGTKLTANSIIVFRFLNVFLMLSLAQSQPSNDTVIICTVTLLCYRCSLRLLFVVV